MLRSRLERDALRNRPACERAVALEPEVVVEARRIVPLDDEDRLLRIGARDRASSPVNGSGVVSGSRFRRYSRSGGMPVSYPPSQTRFRRSGAGMQASRGGQLRSAIAGLNAFWSRLGARTAVSGFRTGEKPVEDVETRFAQARTPIERNFRRRLRGGRLGECCQARREHRRGPRRATVADSSWLTWAPPTGSGTIPSMTPSSRQCARRLQRSAAFCGLPASPRGSRRSPRARSPSRSRTQHQDRSPSRSRGRRRCRPRR